MTYQTDDRFWWLPDLPPPRTKDDVMSNFKSTPQKVMIGSVELSLSEVNTLRIATTKRVNELSQKVDELRRPGVCDWRGRELTPEEREHDLEFWRGCLEETENLLHLLRKAMMTMAPVVASSSE